MLPIALLLAASSASHVGATAGVPWYGKCGGERHDGLTFCALGSTCTRRNDNYSQCVPDPEMTSPSLAGPYEKCGGKEYTGNIYCAAGLQCIWVNEYYSQCIPEHQLADLGEPCGPATHENKKCALQTRASGAEFMKCSSDTDADAKCVPCGFLGVACCPVGFRAPDRPACQAAPRVTYEIPCNVEVDVCELKEINEQGPEAEGPEAEGPEAEGPEAEGPEAEGPEGTR